MRNFQGFAGSRAVAKEGIFFFFFGGGGLH